MNRIRTVEWNVYIGNFNKREIETYNIFRHVSFTDECKKILRKYQKLERDTGAFDRDSFSEEIRRQLMYYFWSKCEWEVVVSHWPPFDSFKSEKIDVYEQVRLNWDIFIDYLWSHRKEIIKWKRP